MESMDCDVCFDGFDEEERAPRILPCGHSICHSCFLGSFKDGQLACPFCRKVFPTVTSDNIPVNFTFLKVLRALRACSNKPPMGSDDKLPSSPASPQVAVEPKLHDGICIEHGFYKTFWCRKCQVWLCHACTVIDHPSSTCLVTSIKSALDKIKEDENEMIKSVEDAKAAHVSLLGEYKGKLDACDANIDEHLATFSKIMQELKDMKTVLKEEHKMIENCLSEGGETFKKLTDAAGTLSQSESVSAITKARSESDECRTNVVRWIKSSNDDLDKSNVLKTSQKMHTELALVLKTAESRQGSSFHTIAPCLIDCLSKVSMNNFTAVKELQLLCSLSSSVWVVKADQSRAAPLSCRKEILYLHALRDESPPDGAVVLQYDDIKSFIGRAPEVFMEFTQKEKKLGTIHIQMGEDLGLTFHMKESSKRRDFLHRCSGEDPNSFMNCKMIKVLGTSGGGKDRLCCGDGSDVQEDDAVNELIHEKGLVTLAESDSKVAFCMWYRDPDKIFGSPVFPALVLKKPKGQNVAKSGVNFGNLVFKPKFEKLGKITKNVNLVETAAEEPDVTEVHISDCGIIIREPEFARVKIGF